MNRIYRNRYWQHLHLVNNLVVATKSVKMQEKDKIWQVIATREVIFRKLSWKNFGNCIFYVESFLSPQNQSKNVNRPHTVYLHDNSFHLIAFKLTRRLIRIRTEYCWDNLWKKNIRKWWEDVFGTAAWMKAFLRTKVRQFCCRFRSCVKDRWNLASAAIFTNVIILLIN
jgi:hypothetical protein